MKKLIFIPMLYAAICSAQITAADSIAQQAKNNIAIGATLTAVGPLTIGGGAALIAVAVKNNSPRTRALSIVQVVSGGLLVGAGVFELVYGPALIVKGKKMQRTAPVAILHVPEPVLFTRHSPGVSIRVTF